MCRRPSVALSPSAFGGTFVLGLRRPFRPRGAALIIRARSAQLHLREPSPAILEFLVIRVGIVGATGYTGVELLRLLAFHPEVEIVCITSRGEEGRAVSELYPSLRGRVDLRFVAPDPAQLQSCDAIFFCTPHGVAQAMLPELVGRDLAGGPKI